MTDHKATPEQWADAGAFASDTRACLLELRARVEALEAAQQDKLDRLIAQDRDDAPVAAGSLVERVSCAIDGRINPDQWLHQDAARAAIREVARWIDAEARERGLQTHNGVYSAAAWLRGELEQEAER